MKYLSLVILGLAVFSVDGHAEDAKQGASSYKLCASCHGLKGEGSQLVNAPALAGQEDWYLERQIENFRTGVRGSESDDRHGQTMAKMTMALGDQADVADLVAYIGTLPIPNNPLTLAGDANNGKALYTTCAACHGAAGEGNRALNAPALSTMQDWYQVAQLEKFRNGTRGANNADVYGMQMAPMVSVLPDAAAMRDVVAYVNSLQ